jgi:hypothetical protein
MPGQESDDFFADPRRMLGGDAVAGGSPGGLRLRPWFPGAKDPSHRRHVSERLPS